VERSADGITFGPIGHVSGKGFDNTYGFEDPAGTEKSYYRLKLTTPDAESVYTDTVLITTDILVNKVGIQPNPFRSSINIRFAAGLHGMAQITMYDVSGRKIYEGKQMAYGVASFTPSNIGAGTYLVTVVINNKLYNIKAIKQ
jgi:Secretion system C-terminal sorting domain